jgi:hypothetical protein
MTPWPLSVVFRQQGVSVTINPQRHWWCLWLCTSTDDVGAIACEADLHAVLEGDAHISGTCSNCGDLTIRSGGSSGWSPPWLYQSADFRGRIVIGDSGFAFDGSFVYSL